jgi:hypothetical protein
MKNEITVPDHFPELKKEDLRIATERREKYSLFRDLLAEENNVAIARRLAKDKEK